MAKIRHMAQGAPLNEWFLDSLQETLSGFVSGNFALTQASATSLQIVAGAGSSQVAIAVTDVGGTVLGWRYIAATISGAVPGGLAVGTHDVYVTASANAFASNPTPPPNELDNTIYTFALKLLATGTTPSGSGTEAYYRKIGTFTWNGSAITDVRQSVGGAAALIKHAATHSPGAGDALDFPTIAAFIHLVGTLGARPAAAAGNGGMTYLATDDRGGTTYRSNGAAWVQQSASLTHAAAHIPGAADPIAWEASIHMRGTFAARPAYSATYAGVLYYAFDTATLYRGSSTLVAWEQIAGAAAGISDQGVTRRMLTAGLISQELGLTWWEGVSGLFVSGDPRTALQISQNAGWVVNVAAGACLIQGDDGSTQGMYPYVQPSGGTFTLPTHNPAVNPRIDVIGVQFNDPAYTGRTPAYANVVQILGNETAGATLANRNGAPGGSGGPAFPPSTVWLADILIATSDGSVQAGNIGDKRKAAGPAIWGEDGKRYRLGFNASGVLGQEVVV